MVRLLSIASRTLPRPTVKRFGRLDESTGERVYWGTICPAETLKVLGEGYTPQDDEDAAVGMVTGIAITRGCTYTHVNMAKAGNWVLLQ